MYITSQHINLLRKDVDVLYGQKDTVVIPVMILVVRASKLKNTIIVLKI